MKTSILFLVLALFTHCLHAEDLKTTLKDLGFTLENEIPGKPQASFSPMEKLSFDPNVPKVNVITGEYCEEECDLMVAGAEPLSINRFYNHMGGFLYPLHGHWRFNLDTFMLFNFEKVGIKNEKIFAAAGEQNGSFFVYEHQGSQGYTLDAIKNKSFTNASSYISGQNHPLNTRVQFVKSETVRHYSQTGRRADDLCWWEGFIVDGSGNVRIFKTDVLQWPQAGKDWPTAKYYDPDLREIVHYPLEFQPPYQALITEERKANGNVIKYEYEDINKSNNWGDPEFPTSYLLKSIKAYSKKGVFLGSIEIKHARHFSNKRFPSDWIDQTTFVGSDGRNTVLTNKQREVGYAVYDSVLHNVVPVGKPDHVYDYIWQRPKEYYKQPFMFNVLNQDGRSFQTTYYHDNKVASQRAPVGPNNQVVPIASYEYGQDFTCVYDGVNNKTVYRFNADKRITSIDKFEGGKLYSVEKNEWDTSNGNLLRKKIEDSSGKLLHVLEYTYDENHNPVRQRTGSSLDPQAECDITHRIFTNDGFNLLKEESDRPGKKEVYQYFPGTNLLFSQLTLHNGHICKRVFHFYDEELGSVCVKSIIDDGINDNYQDISGVTFRKIVELVPKRTLPCIGLPEEIREKTIDEKGNECLLKKVRFSYHPSGKVTQEDHFDALGNYRYSVINEYDQKERLISKTDPLGHKTRYTYDLNFNLISQDGPRADMHKEWIYDAANRPIQEKEWLGDGTVLTTQRCYDRASRVISQTDPCGFENQYDYDSSGRVVAIRYPDGTLERKAYDVLGNITAEKDANGYVTRTQYNFRSQPVCISYSDGTREYFTYNNNSQTLASHTQTNGIKQVYTYDLFGNVVKTETYSADGVLMATTSATYSPFCKLSETDEAGVTTWFTYDRAGRKIGEKKGEKVTTYAYDEQGLLSRVQEQDLATLFFYDLLGRVIEKKIEGSKLYFQEKYGYDEAGNRIKVETCEGVTETQYNARGEPIRTIDPLGNVTEISYSYSGPYRTITRDPKGIQTEAIHDAKRRLVDLQVKNEKGETIQRREKQYDPVGNTLRAIEHVFEGSKLRSRIENAWTYGPKGRVESQLESGTKRTLFLYDEVGRLQTVIKPDGKHINREYDKLSRLARYFGEGLDYRYHYDAKSRAIKVENRINKTILERSYDLYGHLCLEKLDTGVLIHSEYDPYGRKTALHYPNGSSAFYSYNGPYLETISKNGFEYTYLKRNLAGKPTRISLPNHAEIKMKWDPLLRPKAVDSPFFKANYAYDEVGNLVKVVSEDCLGKQTYDYTYDDLKQLIHENESQYGYDSLYNRRSKNGLEYQVSSLNEITHDGEKAYTYDQNGNLISDGTCTFFYDILDRLIAVEKGNKRTTFCYDAFNRRIAKNSDLYIWDSKNEIGMVQNGKIKELRVLGEGLGAEIGSAVFLELDGETYFPIHDHRGSLAALLHPKKAPLTYRFTAFGEQTAGDTSSPWRFVSKRHDPETDLIYFGRRYYAPNLGRFITADPKGFKDGPNLYAYVKNGPLLSIDLYGEAGKHISPREEMRDFCYRLEGIGLAIRDFAFSLFSQMGGWAWSPGESLFEKNSFKGEWENLSWKKISDYPALAHRTLLPYSYDLKHLPASTSREDRLRAEGAASFEKLLLFYTAAKGLQSLSSVSAAVARESAMSLSSREILNSGLTAQTNSNVKTHPIAGGGAKLENLSPSEIRRIQNAANRTNQEIIVVGSRARGTATDFSDWDYIMSGKSSQRHSAIGSLPKGIAGGVQDSRGYESGFDIYQAYRRDGRGFTTLNESLPHIIFKPEE